jgi:hypothetical protein
MFNPKTTEQTLIEHELAELSDHEYMSRNDMIAEGISNFLISICVLGSAAGLGVWLAYLSGR